MSLISVIVPIYNTEKYLEKCINSIINQTYENLEIILINDGSTDNSANICDEFAEKDSRIIVIHKQNGGVSSARNEGIKIAKGVYIGFVDSDDYIDITMYATLYNLIMSSNANISVCDFYNGQEKLLEYETKTYNYKQAVKTMIKDRTFQGHLCNKLYCNTLIKGKQLNEEISIYEDLLFNLEVLQSKAIVIYLNKPLYYYERRQGSATTQKNESFYLNALKAIKKIHLLGNTKYSFLKKEFNYHYYNCISYLVVSLTSNRYRSEYRRIIRKFKKIVFCNLIPIAFSDIRIKKKIILMVFLVNMGLLCLVLKKQPKHNKFI